MFIYEDNLERPLPNLHVIHRYNHRGNEYYPYILKQAFHLLWHRIPQKLKRIFR